MVELCLPSPAWSKIPSSPQEQPRPRPKYATPSTPSTSSRSGRYQVDSLGSGTSTKSCMSIFNGSHKRMFDSKASSESSSISQPLRPNAQSEFAQAWEDFAKQPDDQEQPKVDDSSWQFGHEGQEDIGSFALLQPPKPTDRSHKQRLKLEQEKRRAGVYEGEIEPEGVRGQEASVVIGGGTDTDGLQTSTPIRTFDTHHPATHRQTQHQPKHQPPANPPVKYTLQPSQQPVLETIAEASESRASDSVGSWTSNPLSQATQKSQMTNKSPPRRQPRTVSPGSNKYSSPSRSLDPPAHSSYESSSTSSDEDISRMMADFLYQDRNNDSLNSSLVERDYPNPIGMPKSDWKPNAQLPAAARELRQRPIPITVSGSSGNSSETSASPYRPQVANRISPDPSNSSSILKSPKRQGSMSGILPPPPQNQHSPRPHLVGPEGNSQYSLASNSPRADNSHQSSTTSQSFDSWNALALQHVHNGEYDMALAAFQHVLRAYKQQYGNVHPLVASAYHNLGTVHAKRAQLLLDDTLHQRHCRAQSLQCFQSAARAARDSLGRDHPNVAVSLVRIGFLLLQARQYNNAVITFQEALRIRQTHYGPHHALVANLYNNLGVCYMHLGQFAHGRDLLHHALAIQRTLLQQAQDEAEEKKESHTAPAATSQALELADTLFNIGGLALEWIRRQGPDVRHAEDAEAAFEEALELRQSVLGPNDPMVLQVKSLLDMARSIPRPKSPGRRAIPGEFRSTRGSGNFNFHPDAANQSSRPPDPMGFSPGTAARLPPMARKGEQDGSLSPPRTGRPLNFQPSLGNDGKATSPYRYYGKSESDTSSPSRASPARPPQQTQPKSTSPLRYNSNKADYLEPPQAGAKSLLDQTDSGNPSEKPKPAMSVINSQVGRMSVASSTASTVKMSSPGRESIVAQPSPTQIGSDEQRSLFRPGGAEKDQARLVPPMMEIAVSQDEEDDGLYDPAALQIPAQTDIFISPHYVPHMSPHKVNNMSNDDTPRSVASSSFSGAPTSITGSSLVDGAGGAIVKTYSYDPEEQLVLTDGLGSKNNPLPDDYDAMNSMPPTSDNDTSSTRKIMVVRPYRSTPDDSITSPTSVLSSKPWDLTTSGDGKGTNDTLYSSELNYSSKTTSYSEDMAKNARSETLSRARALLQAHGPDYLDSPQVQLTGKATFLGNSPDRVKQRLFKPGQGPEQSSFDEDLEDGLAPLGGNEAASMPHKNTFHPQMLTNKPEEHLREIYEEASRCLKNHFYEEATEYFKTILQCQRRRHGPFHQDVAAALHNCGLAQLRAGHYHEALKSFEEAVRIRKGTLGKEHPHVAASLVKSGITFLLLHRFEEALWSFREALSIRRNSLGALHPSTARIYNNIGCVHVEFNELQDARRAFEGALDIQRNALCHDPTSGPVRFGLAATLCNLGYLYRYRNMHERAAQVLKEAAEIQEDILGGTHPTVLSTLDSLAEALANSGQPAEAYKTQQSILDRFVSSEPIGTRRLQRAEAGLKYKMSKSAKQMNNRVGQIKNLQEALQAVRLLDEPTEAAREQANALEKRILADLREARGLMEANDLKWV